MTRTVPVHRDEAVLSEFLEQAAEVDLVRLTKDGQRAAVDHEAVLTNRDARARGTYELREPRNARQPG